MSVYYPDKIKQWIKLKNYCIEQDGCRWIPPQVYEMTVLGGAIGIGDTLLEAIKKGCDVARQVEAFQVEVRTDPIIKAVEELRKSETERGMKFGYQPLPSREQVAEAVGE